MFFGLWKGAISMIEGACGESLSCSPHGLLYCQLVLKIEKGLMEPLSDLH